MFKELDYKDLFAQAFLEMVNSVDKGLDPRDIEALCLGNFSSDFFLKQSHLGPIITDLLGIVPRPAVRLEGACASSALAFRAGVQAVASGMYDIVLVGGIEEMSKRSTEEVTEGLAMASSPYEWKTGFTFPGIFAAIATAYFDRYKASPDDLFAVTIKSHENAKLNPKAQFGVTILELMEQRVKKAKAKGEVVPSWENERAFLADPRVNPMIAWPLRLFDCSPISDGACCLLLVSEEIAKGFTDTPIHVVGLGQGSGYALHAKEDLTQFEATKQAAKEAYAMSGIGPMDIQIAEVHDCFSIAEVVHIEDLGFFAPGEGLKATNEGLTRRNGPKPINTSGGLKCKGHPVGATGVAQILEVWLQLKGRAGERQVPIADLRLGAAHNLGGTGGTCTLTILQKGA
jgi:acetyl-CoA acetyltransferase